MCGTDNNLLDQQWYRLTLNDGLVDWGTEWLTERSRGAFRNTPSASDVVFLYLGEHRGAGMP